MDYFDELAAGEDTDSVLVPLFLCSLNASVGECPPLRIAWHMQLYSAASEYLALL